MAAKLAWWQVDVVDALRRGIRRLDVRARPRRRHLVPPFAIGVHASGYVELSRVMDEFTERLHRIRAAAIEYQVAGDRAKGISLFEEVRPGVWERA